ncbi:hypothetical protein BG011_008138 [Mortierella polycephala]|uniref:Uncharacterized protein n=1 Tax=Mortierella polycephala TaxID=41804 RepID=A0A9P6PR50_9FUNG|nr:hypothetical protein BG011_008138 [Mortierella polycephala]
MASFSCTSLARCLSFPRPGIRSHVRCISNTPSYYSKKKTAFATSGNSAAATKPSRNRFVAPPNSVLAYVGPYAATLGQAKSVAFVFGACGCIAVPSTIFLGNPEHLLAIMAGIASLWPSIMLHTLFRNDVTKIHVQGDTSTKTPASVSVTATELLKLTIEKLSWRGSPLLTQVLSTQLFMQSESEKTVTWTTSAATAFTSSSLTAPKTVPGSSPPKALKKEKYRVDKAMMLSNPSFSFVMDQIEHQSRLSHAKYK